MRSPQLLRVIQNDHTQNEMFYDFVADSSFFIIKKINEAEVKQQTTKNAHNIDNDTLS